MSDSLGGGPPQEEGQGGPEQGAGCGSDDDRTPDASGREEKQRWRFCPLNLPIELKDTHLVRLTTSIILCS